MARTEYSDIEKAEALAVLDGNGGNIAKTSRELGIAYSTLRSWKNGNGVNGHVAELREGKKRALSELTEEFAHKAIRYLAENIDSGSFGQVATAFGIAVDKMQLLRGQPTAINEDRLSDDERRKRIAEILDAGRTRGTGPAADGLRH